MVMLNYYLDRRQINKDGTSPLKIMVNTSQNNFMITMILERQLGRYGRESVRGLPVAEIGDEDIEDVGNPGCQHGRKVGLGGKRG